MGCTMRPLLALSVNLAVLWVIAGSSAHAQYSGYQPSYRPNLGISGYSSLGPPVSPYVNLLRRNNPLFLNYEGLVRPQLEFRRSIQNLQQEAISNRQEITGLETQGIPATGHPTQFFNT